MQTINSKQSKSNIRANNWKKKEIENVIILRDQMIAKNIDKPLIDEYLDEQYERINKEYEERINKYNNKKQTEENQIINDNKKKRKKAINFLLLNKKFLEDNGTNPEYIKQYVDSQYEKINKRFNVYIKDDFID